MKGLLALVDRAIQLGRQTVNAEEHALLRAQNAEPWLEAIFRRVAKAAGGLRGQRNTITNRYAEPHVMIGTTVLYIENGALSDMHAHDVGRVFQNIKGVLSSHIRTLEIDYKQAKQRTEGADDAYYTARALVALLDVEGVPAHRKEEIVRRAFKESVFRDAMDAVSSTAEKDAIGKFIRDQAGVESSSQHSQKDSAE